MEVRRSRGGKVGLVIGGNNIIKFVMIGGNCPEFGSMPVKEFYKEFNKVLGLTPEDAAMSFLKAAKRAYKHNQAVITFLLGEIILKKMQESTLGELVLVYNNLCVAAGRKPRKTFDSKAAALEAIEKLDATLKAPTPEQINSAEQSSRRSKMEQETAVGENGEVVVVEAKPRGKGIGARAMELLIEGKSTQEVIDTVSAEIEGANPTPATIAWYKNKLRKEGKIPMPVKKDPAEKKARKAKAVEAVEEMAEGADDDEGNV